MLREPLVAAGLAGTVAVSLAQPATPQLLVLARRDWHLRLLLWSVGAVALVLSVVVAREFGWPRGSPW